MSTGVPLWLIRKDLGISLEKGLPHVLGRKVTLRQILIFCGYYRRMGIVELFLSGQPEGLFENLSKSAWAFAFYLEGAKEPAKATSQCEPFFDAIACADLGAARTIAERSRTTWNADEEYEEDFLYSRFLMDHFTLGAGQSHLEALLRRYEKLLEGGDDSRLQLCRALFEGDQKLFYETLDRLIDDRKLESEKKMKSGQVSPNDAATVFHLWVELLALLRFAGQARLTLARNYPLAPSVARRVELARLPPGDSWKDIPSYYDLE